MTNPCDPESPSKVLQNCLLPAHHLCLLLGTPSSGHPRIHSGSLNQSRPALLKERCMCTHSRFWFLCAEKESRGQCQWQWGEKDMGLGQRQIPEGFPQEVTFQHEGPSNRRNELILQHGFWVGISTLFLSPVVVSCCSFQGGLHRSLETAFI